MKPIPVAFIGGSIHSAVGNTHRIASQMDGRFHLAAGCFSRDAEINSQTGLAWGVSSRHIYTDWKSMLEAEKSVVVVLLTPTPHHWEVLEYALSLNHRIICEKSLTTSVRTTKLLAEQVLQRSSSIHAVYNYTGYPMLREMREIINSGVLGELIHCEIDMPQEGYLRRDSDGLTIKPQVWRQQDDYVPTVSLDLGVHVVNLFRFITNHSVLRIVGSYQTRGNIPGVVDSVSALVECSNELKAEFRFGKTSLGHSNGLSISCFGTHGSVRWKQTDPEFLLISDTQGVTRQIHRGTTPCHVAHLPRYNRFKAGHPSGFLEAFSNHYFDIAEDLDHGNQDSPFTFSSIDALTDMKILEALSTSVLQKQWVEVAE